MKNYKELDEINAPDDNINPKKWKIMIKAVAMYVTYDYKMYMANKAGVNLDEFADNLTTFIEDIVLDCLDIEKTYSDGIPGYEIGSYFWQEDIVSEWFEEISYDYRAMVDSGEFEPIGAIEACAMELYIRLSEGIVVD